MHNSAYTTDVAIVGSGPAGLAAAVSCTNSRIAHCIIDCGKPIDERTRSKPEDIATGVGGAGLYSDGKFSFFPSASKLWMLPDKVALASSYDWYRSLIGPFIGDFPKLPQEIGFVSEKFSSGVVIKRYPSFHIPLDDRKVVIDQLVSNIAGTLLSETEVLHIEFKGDRFLSKCRDRGTGNEFYVTSKALILAAGRFAGTTKKILPALSTTFRRFEVGVRIEQPASSFFLSGTGQLDPKLIIKQKRNGPEWRTFCACSEGEVVESEFMGIRSFSGRSDCPPTGRSNVGFNVRFENQSLKASLRAELMNVVNGGVLPFRASSEDFLSGKQRYFGEEVDALLRDGLSSMLPHGMGRDTEIVGPCIEGVGFYPDIDENLKSKELPIWVVGDSTGLFRGLTAAFVSGYYVGQHVVKYIRTKKYSDLPIKESSTESLPVVFTAQSKAYFYCRDAICEFVMRDGKLPLNPFRVFEYFLNDRVDRNIVRRGNNRLIALAEEVWVFGPIADGVLFEIIYAKKMNKPVRFFNIDSHASEIRPINGDEIVFEPEVHARQVKKADLLKWIDAGAIPADFDFDAQLKLQLE